MSAMEKWAGLGSVIASIMFLYSMLSKYFPFQIEPYIKKYGGRFVSRIYPYVQIKIPEYSGERLKRGELYTAVESYLSSSCSQRASKLKVDFGKDSENLVLSMDDNEEITDEYKDVKLWWKSTSSSSRPSSNPFYPAPEERSSFSEGATDLDDGDDDVGGCDGGRLEFWRNAKLKCFDDVVAVSKDGEGAALLAAMISSFDMDGEGAALLAAMISSFDMNEGVMLEEKQQIEEEEDNVQ